jgi:hypothetical protein
MNQLSPSHLLSAHGTDRGMTTQRSPQSCSARAPSCRCWRLGARSCTGVWAVQGEIARLESL